jgi:hypothetical protein
MTREGRHFAGVRRIEQGLHLVVRQRSAARRGLVRIEVQLIPRAAGDAMGSWLLFDGPGHASLLTLSVSSTRTRRRRHRRSSRPLRGHDPSHAAARHPHSPEPLSRPDLAARGWLRVRWRYQA